MFTKCKKFELFVCTSKVKRFKMNGWKKEQDFSHNVFDPLNEIFWGLHAVIIILSGAFLS